ncbi:alpha-1a adrenergic receptor [Plakobranchus ocellatus]|uniref:Alpha-1a adrenergic receptor n=1 Tax=Plakobranchus ocellatus TaxID=259542 RepID=A0AAV4B6M9_9GAST|nr:alpha-1a adrenergic receptor [Plakobranchus ocellatus]
MRDSNISTILTLTIETTTTFFGLFTNDYDIINIEWDESDDNNTNMSFPCTTFAPLFPSSENIFDNLFDAEENSTTASPQPARPSVQETSSAVVTGIVLYILVLITLVGNFLVLLAIYVEKTLQTAFNFFIVNLAICDMCVAATAMSFYATDMMLGYWPFGSIVCALWIFFDYGMTFASVFTLVAISTDRFWSVYWSVQYRSVNKKKKSLTMIAIVW